MKKITLSLTIVSGLLVSTMASAAGGFTNFGADLSGGASFFPNGGSYGYSFSDPYGGVAGAGAATKISKTVKPNKNGTQNTTQNNLGGTVLVVNANAPVNVNANLSNKGNITIKQP